MSDTIFLKQPTGNSWRTWTWKQAGDECRRMAAALHALQLPTGSHVAILSKNCAHWIMADIAIMMAGCVSIPIYPTLTAASIEPILTHSDAKAIFVGKLDDYTQQKAGIPDTLQRISFDAYGITESNTWTQLVANHTPIKEMYRWSAEDIMTIIYTSGTTGQSKGVMHTAETFDIVLTLALQELYLPKNGMLFSYLPLSHIAERLATEMNAFYNGCTVSFAESLESFAENLSATQPHCFFAVPRIWGKFREGILKKLPEKKLNTLLSIPLLSTFIKKSIRKKLGLGRATHIYSAAAPIAMDILLWFEKLGIPIYQAYGMTEDCVYAHFERPGKRQMGSVGKALPGLKVKITEDGEIRVKSRGNMKGYYKETELTVAMFDEEGYMKTGDKGEYDHDGFLFITGRVKDQFKTDKGKYISPAPIEMKLLACSYIEQVCVVGMGIPQPIALVTLSDIGKAAGRNAIENILADLLQQINPSLENYERMAKAVVMKENWTVENGLLTPTLKVKRNQVEKIHQQFYPGWFHAEGMVLWE
ncbi:MAG: AMP-binding protein [Chitinophagaceae bacterium]